MKSEIRWGARHTLHIQNGKSPFGSQWVSSVPWWVSPGVKGQWPPSQSWVWREMCPGTCGHQELSLYYSWEPAGQACIDPARLPPSQKDGTAPRPGAPCAHWDPSTWATSPHLLLKSSPYFVFIGILHKKHKGLPNCALPCHGFHRNLPTLIPGRPGLGVGGELWCN